MVEVFTIHSIANGSGSCLHHTSRPSDIDDWQCLRCYLRARYWTNVKISILKETSKTTAFTAFVPGRKWVGRGVLVRAESIDLTSCLTPWCRYIYFLGYWAGNRPLGEAATGQRWRRMAIPTESRENNTHSPHLMTIALTPVQKRKGYK